MAKIDLRIAISLPPEEAINYFRSKGYQISFNWHEVWQEAHAKAFTVAKAMQMDVLQSIRKEVDAALADGTTVRDFVKTLEPRLKKMGWWGRHEIINESGEILSVQLGSVWRLKNIYRINLQTAYMTGRYKRQLENAGRRPFWQYIAVMDSRTRPTHRALHKKVFRFDDPIWDSLYPPNGWGCRCRVRSLTQKQIDSRGLTVDNSNGKLQAFDSEFTEGKTATVTGYEYAPGKFFKPDAGWSYNPGKAAWSPDLEKYDDDLVNQFQRQSMERFWKSDTAQAAWHNASFIDAPENIKRAIQHFDDDFLGLIPAERSGAYYIGKRIHMGTLNNSNYHSQGTWRHEYGHFLDDQLGSDLLFRSAHDDFSQIMREDIKNIVNSSGYGRRSKKRDEINNGIETRQQTTKNEIQSLDKQSSKVYLEQRAEQLGFSFSDIEAFVSNETMFDIDSADGVLRVGRLLQSIEDRDAGNFMQAIYDGLDWTDQSKTYRKGLTGYFSDLVGSGSNNKLLGAGPHGHGGHSNNYLKQAGMKETEVFANMTALLGSNDTFWRTTVETYFPHLSQLYIKIIETEL